MKIRKPRRMTNAKLFALFYGLTDSGKTYILGTADSCELTKPALFINIDGGDLTLADTDIHIVDVANFSDLQEVYDYLRLENTKYKSVCIDSLTAQQRDISMPAVLTETKGSAVFTVGDLSIAVPPSQYDWLASGQQMKNLFQALKRLTQPAHCKTPIHVFASAGERVDERRDIGVPALPGVLGLEVGGYVDVLGRMVLDLDEDTGKETRILRTVKYMADDGFVYLGKNRGRKLPRAVKNPSIDKLMQYWNRTTTNRKAS